MASIPLSNKLEIYIYSREKNTKENPIKKYFLAIRQQEDGFWIVDATEKKEKKGIDSLDNKPPTQKIGHFTNLVIAKRQKKKKK